MNKYIEILLDLILNELKFKVGGKIIDSIFEKKEEKKIWEDPYFTEEDYKKAYPDSPYKILHKEHLFKLYNNKIINKDNFSKFNFNQAPEEEVNFIYSKLFPEKNHLKIKSFPKLEESYKIYHLSNRFDKIVDLSFSLEGNTKIEDISITLTKGVIKNMTNMFNGCTNLENVVFDIKCEPEFLRVNFMFNDCSSLKTIHFKQELPSTYLNEVDTIFNGCTNLEKITFDVLSPTFQPSFETFKDCVNLKSPPNLNYSLNYDEYWKKVFQSCLHNFTKIDKILMFENKLNDNERREELSKMNTGKIDTILEPFMFDVIELNSLEDIIKFMSETKINKSNYQKIIFNKKPINSEWKTIYESSEDISKLDLIFIFKKIYENDFAMEMYNNLSAEEIDVEFNKLGIESHKQLINNLIEQTEIDDNYLKDF